MKMIAGAMALLGFAVSAQAGGFSLMGVASSVVGDVKKDATTVYHSGESLVKGLEQGSDPHLKAGADLVGCQFAGHNTYDEDGHGHSKLDLALEAGLHAIEVDESWGVIEHKAIVTHSGAALGLTEPKLEDYLEKVWSTWASAPGDDYLLVLDLKCGSADLAHEIHRILQKHAALLSHMGTDGVYHPGKITVMFTGNGTTESAYEQYARANGGYLAFGHRGDPSSWQADAGNIVPAEAPGFVRLLNLSVRDLLADSTGKSLDDISPERVKALTDRAHAAGYRVRIWLVNALKKDGTLDTRPWRTLIAGGVDWIATDNYQQAADYWRATHP